MPAILYALVARGRVVLAEYSLVQGNTSVVALQLLEKLPASGADVEHASRSSYVAEQHVFHLLNSGGVTYLCMAEEAIGRRLPFAFLESVENEFRLRHGAAAASAVAYEYSADFAPVLRDRLELYNSPRADAVGRVRGEVGALREVMVDNIEKVLERGERLELLVRKTEDLAAGTVVFKRGAQRLQSQSRWRGAQTTALIVALAALGLYALAAFLCGPALHC